MSTEESYIEERKKQAKELSDLFISMQKYPIQNNKIVFSAFEGDGGFCCNPRYIAEELHKKNVDLELVWLVKDTSKSFPKYIKVYEYTMENIAYHLSTARVWIDNYRKPFGTIKRDGQIYIQTWHASMGFKAVGLYRGDLFPKIARMVSEWDSALIDYVISNSEYCDKIYPKKLLYDGPTIRSGSPRVDCLINKRDVLYRSVRKQYGIDDETKLLLYAPTFRGGNNKDKKNVIAEISSIDFDRVTKTLEEKTKSKWKVLLRLHPQLAARIKEMPVEEHKDYFIDVSQADDISELLAASDLVITDYSSCAFDAAFAYIPVLLYADDVQDYVANRGQFMWKKEELPFDMAESNEGLLYNIWNFDIKEYERKVESFMNANGVCEDGRAGEKVVKLIY